MRIAEEVTVYNGRFEGLADLPGKLRVAAASGRTVEVTFDAETARDIAQLVERGLTPVAAVPASAPKPNMMPLGWWWRGICLGLVLGLVVVAATR